MCHWGTSVTQDEWEGLLTGCVGSLPAVLTAPPPVPCTTASGSISVSWPGLSRVQGRDISQPSLAMLGLDQDPSALKAWTLLLCLASLLGPLCGMSLPTCNPCVQDAAPCLSAWLHSCIVASWIQGCTVQRLPHSRKYLFEILPEGVPIQCWAGTDAWNSPVGLKSDTLAHPILKLLVIYLFI